MSEQFDFRKTEDQEIFANLKPTEKEKIINDAHGEALELEARKTWEKQYQKTRQLIHAIQEEAEKLSAKRIIKHRLSWFGFLQQISLPKLEKLAGTKDLRKYAAFHPFIGSSANFEACPTVDLPGDLIFNFASDLLIKLQTANRTGKLEL